HRPHELLGNANSLQRAAHLADLQHVRRLHPVDDAALAAVQVQVVRAPSAFADAPGELAALVDADRAAAELGEAAGPIVDVLVLPTAAAVQALRDEVLQQAAHPDDRA